MAANANIIIEQKPLFLLMPVAQPIIYTVSDNTLVATKERVKFIAEVYVSKDLAQFTSNPSDVRVANLKTTPNNAGVGMFDIRPIVESYVKAENLANGENSGVYSGTVASTFKGQEFTDNIKFPLHVIDQFSLANEVGVFFTVTFKIEYLDGNSVIIDDNIMVSPNYYGFNGYVKNEQILNSTSGDFGLRLNSIYDKKGNFIDIIQRNSSSSRFLSRSPLTQYARLEDYGTVSMFNRLSQSEFSFVTAPSGVDNAIGKIRIKLYNASNVQLGSDIVVTNNNANGGGSLSQYADINKQYVMFFGVYPANLSGGFVKDSSLYADWNTNKANVSYYTVQALDSSSNEITQLLTINIICDSGKGYEPIRLTWLNEFGAWDYYTFNQKSIKSLGTNKTSYTQLRGTWNESKYAQYGYDGGKKNFTMNTTERIKINTDYLNDSESEWIESMMNSPEVYIINEFSFDQFTGSINSSGFVNKYVEPVIVTTSSFTRKTVANDKLIQYTIDIERNKTQRTQAV
tara:strand:- start:10729 stop:12270 length:1542 start_codon:yes stop_codon:yes gene_type:complete